MSTGKTISLTDLALLKKILGMTTSSNDAEALSAMRKANALLTKYKLTWEDVLARTITVIGAAAPLGEPVAESEEVTLETQITRAFDELRGVHLGDFRSFVDSLETQFMENKYLSAAQRKPLFDAVRRQREKMKDVPSARRFA